MCHLLNLKFLELATQFGVQRCEFEETRAGEGTGALEEVALQQSQVKTDPLLNTGTKWGRNLLETAPVRQFKHSSRGLLK